jgi:hypothetical protein
MSIASNFIGGFARKGRFLLAVVTFLTGFGIMWGSTVGGARAGKIVSETSQIDAGVPDPAFNGKLVLAAAKLESPQLLGDEYIKSAAYLVLRRRVEMYQWVQRSSAAAEGSKVTSYDLQWYEGEQDTFSFVVPKGHENPLLKVAPAEQRVSTVQFGGFEGSKVISKIARLGPLRVTAEMLSDPSLPIEEGRIYLRRTAGTIGPAIGDMRVWYEALLPGDYSVFAVQKSESTLLGDDSRGVVFIKAGRVGLKELSKELEGDRDVSVMTLILVGAAILFIGLLSLLLPMSSYFDLRPTVELHGKAAVAFVSFVVSLGLALLFGVAAYVG